MICLSFRRPTNSFSQRFRCIFFPFSVQKLNRQPFYSYTAVEGRDGAGPNSKCNKPEAIRHKLLIHSSGNSQFAWFLDLF